MNDWTPLKYIACVMLGATIVAVEATMKEGSQTVSAPTHNEIVCEQKGQVSSCKDSPIPDINEDLMTKQLYLLANLKLNDLKETGHWSHDNKNGKTFSERVKLVGLKSAGEILYKGDCNYSRAIQLWEKSESHRNILLDTSYTHMVSVMGISGNTCYIVQEYAK